MVNLQYLKDKGIGERKDLLDRMESWSKRDFRNEQRELDGFQLVDFGAFNLVYDHASISRERKTKKVRVVGYISKKLSESIEETKLYYMEETNFLMCIGLESIVALEKVDE